MSTLRRCGLLILLLCAPTTVAARQAGAPHHRIPFRVFGAPEGSDQTRLLAINNRGEIVGVARFPHWSKWQA
jgi:hypothetical protein